MAWVIYYLLLLAAYVACTVYSYSHPSRTPEIVRSISGAVAIATALGQAIAKVNLRFYLFWQRVWVWWNSDVMALWRFAMRLDGNFEPDILGRILDALKSDDFAAWQCQIINRSPLGARLKVDRTLHLQISFEPAETSADGNGHLLIRSEEIEVPYGAAREKIDHQIAPLLSTFNSAIRPDRYSIELEVWFKQRNPFFAFYVAHLRPEQISQFQLIFKPDISRTGNETVVVTEKTLGMTTVTTEGFAELAKAFVLLSSDAARFAHAT